MRNKTSIADYLYFLSAKYKVDCDSLSKGLVHARENSEVNCGKLTIECRLKTNSRDVFLITKGYQVVAQFSLPKSFLDQPNPIRISNCNYLQRKATVREAEENPKNIGDLRCGMKRVNVKARVLSIPKATLVFTRFGEYARVTNALIADETGAIKLCLWNDKINAVSVDSVIQIENARVTKFHGEKQLQLGKTGRLRVVEDNSFPSLRQAERAVA